MNGPLPNVSGNPQSSLIGASNMTASSYTHDIRMVKDNNHKVGAIKGQFAPRITRGEPNLFPSQQSTQQYQMMHSQPSQGTVNHTDPSYMAHANPTSSDYLVAD